LLLEKWGGLMTSEFFGIGLILIGGIFAGTYTLPMKFAPRWPWEAIWLVYSLAGLLLIPIAVDVVTIPNVLAVYGGASAESLGATVLFGLGWGIGSVLFGIGVSRLGMSLGFSIILGLTAALGSLVPLVILTPAAIVSLKGLVLLGGLAVIILGIVLCGAASAESNPSANNAGNGGSRRRTGLIICIAGGICASMLNLAMAFGQDIGRRAVEAGAKSANASTAILVLAVASGAVSCVAYCTWLLVKKRTFPVLSDSSARRGWWLGALMGALFFGGIYIYGRGSTAMGNWGAIVGWPLFIATTIAVANMLGWITGEWRGRIAKARRYMNTGLLALAVGVVLVGYSGAM
jgi:L-rhamnose-H+ transport protein